MNTRSKLARIATLLIALGLPLLPIVLYEFFPHVHIGRYPAGRLAVAVFMGVTGLRMLLASRRIGQPRDAHAG
jgi:hypothetical protein